MTNLDPCLQGCDAALAEAELLIAMLTDHAESLDPEISAVRSRIAALRRQVERLRGMPAEPVQRKIHEDGLDLAAIESPWGRRGSDHVNRGTLGGV